MRILLALIFIAFSILLLRFMTKFKWIVLVVYIAAGGILRHRGLTPLRKCYDSYISTMNRVDTFRCLHIGDCLNLTISSTVQLVQ